MISLPRLPWCGSRWAVACLALTLSCRPAASTLAQLPSPGPPVELGVNLEEVTDWGRSFMFADAMKHSRPWGTLAAPHDELAPVDADGWPTGDAGVLVLVDVPGPLIAGTYLLSFQGSAIVDGTGTIRNRRYDPATRTTRAEVVVSPTDTELILTFAGQVGGVKNVRLMRPGHAEGETFYRPFLERLSRFSVIRGMDYLAINGNPQVNWSDRTLPTHASQQRRLGGGPNRGASWEHLVDLANQTGKDLWVNIPDQATDDYVRQLAVLIRSRLRPNLKIYTEWSNEVWNDAPDFVQTRRNYAAVRAPERPGTKGLGDDGESDPYVLAWRRIAVRGMEVSNIFRQVFGDGAMMSRVRPVLASQMARPEVLSEGLEHVARVYGPPSRYFHACGAADYVGMDERTMSRGDLTLDQIFAAMRGDAGRLREWMIPFSAWCRYHRLTLVAYEGGQHLEGEPSLGAKLAAQMDPRMEEILLLNFRNWFESGGDVFVYFNLAGPWGRFGAWGLGEDVTSEGTPKWRAIAHVLSTPRPAPTIGHVLPATLKPGDAFAVRDFHASGRRLTLRSPTSYAMYLVRAATSGTYTLRASVSGGVGATVRILVDSDPVATWRTGPSRDEARQATVTLAAGLHVVRVQPGSADVEIGPLSLGH